MNKQKKETIAIIGAGLTGCFLAILLAKRGFDIDIYERATVKKMQVNATQRSFNLTFYEYAVNIFKEVGLWNGVKDIVIRLEGVLYQPMYSNTMRFMSFSGNSQNYTLDRSDILQLFIKKAQSYGSISFHFNTALVDVDTHKKTIRVQDVVSKKYRTVSHNVVFGADGVNSIIRKLIPQRNIKVQESSNWSYKQIRFTKEDVKKLSINKSAMYLWVRQHAVMAAFPDMSGEYIAMLILPKEVPNGFANLSTTEKIHDFLVKSFLGFMKTEDTIIHALLHNPEGYFTIVRADTWYQGDFLALVGDSAHGMFPFYGQGTSAAIADAEKLGELIDIYGANWEKIFPLYQAMRKPHTDVLAALSIENFERYRRSHLADEKAVIEKIESILHTYFPQIFLPQISPSIFSDPTHAADLFQKYKNQRKILNFFGMFILVKCIVFVISLHENRLHTL